MPLKIVFLRPQNWSRLKNPIAKALLPPSRNWESEGRDSEDGENPHWEARDSEVREPEVRDPEGRGSEAREGFHQS